MLHLHAAPRIEALAHRLAALLAEAPADPMTSEWIAVPTEGMRRWLLLKLAAHLGASPGASDGVAANVERAMPSSLRLAVLDAGTTATGSDPWRVEHLVWSVLAELVTTHDPVLAPVGLVPPGGSRYARARRIADLFDSYHLHRTDMVLAWSEGRDVDGAGRPLPASQRWQPSLWRALRERIAVPSPPERLPALLAALHDQEAPLQVPALPDRLVMFGLSVLPGGAGFLDLADAVGRTRDLHVFLVEPSPSASLAVTAALGPPGPRARSRAEDRSGDAVAHPLLRTWGRLHRETTVLLADGAREGVAPLQRLEDDRRSAVVPTTLLARLQHDIGADRAPGGDLVPDPLDRSIELHAAHGPARQVEVLRDVLLHLLADEQLELDEDDVLVVCPALDAFAPTIAAVLGPSVDSGAEPSPDTPALRYRLADRSLQRAVPLLDALERLLEVVAGRFDVAGVLDLVALPAVRTRFGFSDDDVARIGEWAAHARVRWGLDEQRRALEGLPAEFDTNTWRAALDRLLVGVAVHDDRQLSAGDVVPIPLSGDDGQLAGRFAELLWRLDLLAAEVGRPRPLEHWLGVLRAAVHQLLEVDRDDGWQLRSLERILAEVHDAAAVETSASSLELDFVDLRRLLAERLGETPGRADFFRGGITISSMTPLRGVPFRVVVLLGADQSGFQVVAPDGDDLVAAAPLLGDRDRRGESRQALLEAVLAARDRLVLVRDGHDVRTNQVVPRAVPVAELVDAVLSMVDEAHRDTLADRLEVHHPRQPFDEVAFVSGALIPHLPWSFDDGARRGALARRAREHAPAELVAAPLEPIEQTTIELADLHQFLAEPVAHFVQRRLGVRLPRRDDVPAPLVPLNLSGLDRWGVGDRLLRWLLDGGDPADWEQVERRLGTLGPGSYADASLEQIRGVVAALTDAADRVGVRRGPSDAVAVDVRLPDGTRVVGTVEDRLVRRRGPARTTYSSYRPGYLLAAWLDLVALVAARPERDWRSVGVHKDPRKDAAVLVELDPVGSDAASRHAGALRALETAVDCYRRGSVEPIPLFPLVSHELWAGRSGTADWVRRQGGGDGASAFTRLVWGDRTLDDLRGVRRRAHDPVSRSGAEADRLVCFAEHLWDAVAASVQRVEPTDAQPTTATAGAPQ